MLQKPSRNLLPGIDYIILTAVFILGVSFTGILLPMNKTALNTEGEQSTLIPYTDITSDRSLQLRNVKFNTTSPNPPEEESETCESATVVRPTSPVIQNTPIPMLLCPDMVCAKEGGRCLPAYARDVCPPPRTDCASCPVATPRPTSPPMPTQPPPTTLLLNYGTT